MVERFVGALEVGLLTQLVHACLDENGEVTMNSCVVARTLACHTRCTLCLMPVSKWEAV